MSFHSISRALVVPALLLPSLFAKDTVDVAVALPSTSTSPSPIMTVNGNPYSPGTFAVGTIQLLYTVSASAFPVGPFAQFTVNLTSAATNSGKTTYPASLSLKSNGGELTLVPEKADFTVESLGWQESVTVAVSIPSNTEPEEDGELVGHLQVVSNDLSTPTSILVKIRLLPPSPENCLTVDNFITDESFSYLVTSTEVNVNTPGKVTSTNPYGELSDNVLVHNGCTDTRRFDLKVNLDPSFRTNPQGNAGNAVFTFMTAGAFAPDPSGIAPILAKRGTPGGEALCVQAVAVAPGDSFLATVHMSIDRGMPASRLPGSGLFGFEAALSYETIPGCNGSVFLNDSTQLTFTKK